MQAIARVEEKINITTHTEYIMCVWGGHGGGARIRQCRFRSHETSGRTIDTEARGRRPEEASFGRSGLVGGSAENADAVLARAITSAARASTPEGNTTCIFGCYRKKRELKKGPARYKNFLKNKACNQLTGNGACRLAEDSGSASESGFGKA